jgi:hypothetical protein
VTILVNDDAAVVIELDDPLPSFGAGVSRRGFAYAVTLAASPVPISAASGKNP